MSGTFKKAIVGFLVVVVGALIYRFVMFEVVTYQFNKMSSQIVEQTREVQQKLLAKQEEEKLLRQEKEAARKFEAERRARVAAEQQRLRHAHERAFETSYQAPKGCDNWISESHMVHCVNHRMRAKAEFDRLHPIASSESPVIYR